VGVVRGELVLSASRRGLGVNRSARSNLLARLVISGVLAPGIGALFARMENKSITRGIMDDGVVDKTALLPDYVDELAKVGHRPGYPDAACAM
jgi:hypothetical protein